MNPELPFKNEIPSDQWGDFLDPTEQKKSAPPVGLSTNNPDRPLFRQREATRSFASIRRKDPTEELPPAPAESSITPEEQAIIDSAREAIRKHPSDDTSS